MRPSRIAFFAGLLALATAARAYPPPVVYIDFNQTLNDGFSDLNYYGTIYGTLDNDNKLVAYTRGSRPDQPTYSEGIVLVSNAGTIEFLETSRTLGAQFGPGFFPPQTLAEIADTSAVFNRQDLMCAAICGSSCSISHGQAFLAKLPGLPFQKLVDNSNPDPLLASLSGARCVVAPASNRVLLQGGDDLWITNVSESPIAFTRITHAGDQVPGLPSGVVYTGGVRTQRINSAGHYTCVRSIDGPGVVHLIGNSIVSDSVIIVGENTTQSVVARAGDPAPGIPGAVYKYFSQALQYELLEISESGELTFTASLNSQVGGAGTPRSIFGGPPGNIGLIATGGFGAIAGLQATVTDLRVAVSPGGQRVIWAGYNLSCGTGHTYEMLFKGTAAAPQIIAQSGQTAPGLPPGTTLGLIRDYRINDAGSVVFRADFTASTQFPTGGTAYFGWTGGPGIFLVMAPGESFSFNGGPDKTISLLSDQFFILNSLGRIAVIASFTDGSAAILGRDIAMASPPVGFALGNPIPNALAVPTSAHLTWDASINADSYSVSITPDGGTTTTLTTTDTSLTLPADLLQGCQSVTWGVTAVNAAGSTASTPVTQQFITFAPACITPPVYTITRIGISDCSYQDNLVSFVTPEGRVAGRSSRVAPNRTLIGQDAWIWSGQTSNPLGLFGAPYETPYLSGIRRANTVVAINSDGKAIGTSSRYQSALTPAGYDAWLSDPTGVQRIGPIGAPYEKTPGAADTRRDINPIAINAQGKVVGSAVRWSPTGSGKILGSDSWLYDGTTTQIIGVSGTGYDFSNGGEIQHDNSPIGINASGDVVGSSIRWIATSPTAASSLGSNSWLISGATTTMLQFAGPELEVQFGLGLHRATVAQFLNDAGQVAGWSARWNASGTSLGDADWIWNAGTFQIINPTDAVHSTTVASGGLKRAPSVKGLSPTGIVVGETARYDASGASLGTDVWCFDGAQTRILRLDGPTYQSPAGAIDTAARKDSFFIGINASGQIVGRTLIQGTSFSQSWIFDPAAGDVTLIQAPPTAVTSFATTLTNSSAALGTFSTPLPGGPPCCPSYTSAPFIWSLVTGMKDLNSRILGGLAPQGWQAIVTPVGGAGDTPYSWPELIAGNGAFPAAYGQQAFVLQAVPQPGGFSLLQPPPDANVGGAAPAAVWAPSDGAQSYTLTLTRQGGSSVTLTTNSTSLSVPPGFVQGCDQISWSVFANSPSGTTLSTPPLQSFSFVPADFDQSGIVAVQDIFDFLNAWFAGDPRTDFDGSNTLTVGDIFNFLSAWFGSC